MNRPRPVEQPPMVGPLAGRRGAESINDAPPTAAFTPEHVSARAVSPIAGLDTITLTARPTRAEAALPFKSPIEHAVPRATPETTDRAAAVGEETNITKTDTDVSYPAPPTSVEQGPLAPGGLWQSVSTSSAGPAWAPSTVESPSPGLPDRPAMIGPLAHVGMSTSELEDKAQAPRAKSTETLPVEPKPTDSPSKIGEFSLERCASITASIARRRIEEATILGENELNRVTWEAIKNRWADAIRKETARGKMELLRRFDVAYIAQLENERGPITINDYARVVVAAERGSVDDALIQLSLPRGSIMRLERVWLDRMKADPTLPERTRDAVEAMRAVD